MRIRGSESRSGIVQVKLLGLTTTTYATVGCLPTKETLPLGERRLRASALERRSQLDFGLAMVSGFGG